jgi:histidine triad (HIT) family protein
VSEKTLFQKLADREIPGDLVYEDDRAVAFRDINPIAPTHVLVGPRKPIPRPDAIEPEDEALVGHLFTVARVVAVQ